ncbi:MAG TPA: DNA helicase RecQ [Chloroflexota bacterium]|nr:DNA helicase RecQ [Chloroflexota bacterium]
MLQEPGADSHVLDTLKATFGYSTFRPLQREIVDSVLAGRDVFVLMPTGGGKSLCYQLPALLKDGVTVVVSPLIALMKDQVDALRALGVAATFVNSTLDSDEITRRQEAVQQGRVKLVYVAPERLMLPGFLKLLAASEIAGFAIDEAHCISEWGHDFRPEYRELARLRILFPAVPLGAFTATATARVQTDIKQQLGLVDAVSFRGSFNRANLFYEVRPKRQAYDQLVAYLRGRAGQSGIVYCGSRATTERLADQLRADGFRATAYHAGLDGGERHRRQEAFVRDDVQIIVATIAFGMGIDKPDVRFVIHHDLPKSLEGYYQESGRAGRDGEPSDCLLFYSTGDITKQRRWIEEKVTIAERRIAEWQLQQIVGWAESETCRREALLAYFDEPFEGQDDLCCDICRLPAVQEDVTVPAQMLMSCIKRTGERFGATYVIDVLRGSRNAKVLQLGHDRLSTHGIGHDRSTDEWRSLVRHLIRRGYLLEDQEGFTTLKVTDRGKQVLFGSERVVVSIVQRPGEETDHTVAQPHADLFERLRVLRKRLADERGIPPYVIFHDTTLRHMAASLPATRPQLLRIPGVGERKALDFGDSFLAEIAGYVRDTGATPQSPPDLPNERKQRRAGKGERAQETVRLFRGGLSIEEIAGARGRAPSTIVSHLADALMAGETLDMDRLVPPQRRAAIEAAMHELGYELLGPIKERLGDDYSYAELHLVRAALRARSTT